jgi:hypothetical protein
VLSPRAILLSEFWASLALVSFLVWPSVYVLAAAFAFQAFFRSRTSRPAPLGTVLAAAVAGTLSRSTRNVPAPEDVVTEPPIAIAPVP